MSSQIAHAYLDSRRNRTPLFYAGWAGFAVFGTLAFLGGDADLSYAVFHVVMAAAICTWYFMTEGKAAPIAGAILGTLFFLQMGVFLFSDIFSGENTALTITLADAFGLVAAILILTGAALGFRRLPTS